MAQIVYLGIESDFTQEAGLLASKVGSKARVVEGLGISVVAIGDDIDKVLLVMQPGIFVMPDGMVVKETEVVKIPLVNMDPTEGGYTLIAKRYSYDVVYYDFVKGEHFQDTLLTAIKDSDPNLVAMPLSFVYKLDSVTEPGKSPALSYSIRDLGIRGNVSYQYLPCPIAGLYQDKVRLEIRTSSETPIMLFHNMLPSIPSNRVLSYLPVYASGDNFLKAISFRGRRNRTVGVAPTAVNVILQVTSQYLKGMTMYAEKATQSLEYVDVLEAGGSYKIGAESLILKTFVYPTGSKITKDLLTIEVINQNPATQEYVGVTPLELNEIILSTLGIFG